MNKSLLCFNFFLIGTIILLNIGCSSSSKSLRYGSKKEKPENTPALRYSSESEEKKSEFTSTSEKNINDEFDEEPPVAENTSKELIRRYYSDNSGSENAHSENYISDKDALMIEIIKFIDTPYKYGGETEKGIDCSAFTQTIFKNIFEYDIPRTAREQYSIGKKIMVTDLNFGDLVFFNTSKRVKPGHVGVYIGNNMFAHASRSLGVTVSSLTEKYYSKRFMGGRRIDELNLYKKN